jgi:hypothetical protein
VLPIPEGDEPLAMTALVAPAVAAGGNPAAEAYAHDATQMPAYHDAAEREREALARIELWHGPGEWQAAMLALSIPPLDAAPDAAGRWRHWQVVCAELGALTQPVRADIAALGCTQRRRVFESLLRRAAAAPPAARRRSWRELSARWWALHAAARHRAPLAWRAGVIRHVLAMQEAATTRATLGGEAAAVLAATRAMARAMDLDETAQSAWQAAALAQLHDCGLPRQRGPALGLAPPTPQRETLLALRVRRLSPMQRPLLLRAWIEAARRTRLLDRPPVGDALHLACIALDVPVPEALLA